MFASVSASGIGESLVGLLRDHSAAVDTKAFDASVFHYSARFGPSVVADVEDELIRAELEAVRSAAPTPAGARAIRSCVESGRRAAVVSNNATSAVVEYLASCELDSLVHTVVGRIYGAPQSMKPSAEPVERALEALSVKPAAAALVGDSPGDIIAAQAAATASIGFANRPEKWRRLAGADVIIDDMAALAAELDSTPVD